MTKKINMAHKIVTEWQSGMHFVADTAGGKVILDADEAVGGKGLGKRPKPLMLVALAGCTGMDVASLLKKMRVSDVEFKIEVSGELTDEHPKIYHTVKVDYFFSGDGVEEFKDKIEKSVSLSVDRYCGVFEMFRQFADVSHEIKYV